MENVAKQVVYQAMKAIGRNLTDSRNLQKPEVRAEVEAYAAQHIHTEFAYIPDLVTLAEKGGLSQFYDVVVQTIEENVIEIPRISVGRMQEIRCGFHDFDLDVSRFHPMPVHEEILIRSLVDNHSSYLTTKGEYHIDSLPNLIISGLMDKPKVDYFNRADRCIPWQTRL